MKTNAAQLVMTIVVDIDTTYLKAVGVNADTAAELLAEQIAERLNHEDYGSTVEQASFVATYTSRGKTRPVHIWNK